MRRSESRTVGGYADKSAARLRMSKANGARKDAPGVEGQPESNNDKWDNVASGVVQSTLPAWVNVGIMTSLIFGGCCANVSTRKPCNDNIKY